MHPIVEYLQQKYPRDGLHYIISPNLRLTVWYYQCCNITEIKIRIFAPQQGDYYTWHPCNHVTTLHRMIQVSLRKYDLNHAFLSEHTYQVQKVKHINYPHASTSVY